MAVVTAKANNSATTASAATASATTACAANDTELPVVRAYELPTLAAGAKWLVRDIWGQQSVGILSAHYPVHLQVGGHGGHRHRRPSATGRSAHYPSTHSPSASRATLP